VSNLSIFSMRTFLLLSLFVIFFFRSFAEGGPVAFEGKISFIRESVFDTTFISIMVKGKMVRIDEHDPYDRLISRRIVNMENGSVIALSPDKKMFTQVATIETPKNKGENVRVMKTGNSKQINGYTCYQWRVKDPLRNTEVAYWVAKERFDFFEKLLVLLNRTESSLSLYQIIPDKDGYFPMLTEERTLLRKEKVRIAVVKISESNLNPKIFEIPKDYQPLRN